jgi:hypothetical protein
MCGYARVLCISRNKACVMCLRGVNIEVVWSRVVGREGVGRGRERV